MTEKAWKRCEREIAGIVGGKRIPVTGRGRGDAPDIRHPWLSIEVKSRRSFPAWLLKAVTQARAAATEYQLPLAVLHQEGCQHNSDLVVLRLADWVEWFGGMHDEGDVAHDTRGRR